MNKRIGFIDAMRGMTMFLVVVAHVMTFGLGINAEKSVLGSILITFRMPTFFLISGFVAYKSLDHWTTRYYLNTLWKKILILVIPTSIFFSTLYITKGQNPITQFFTNGFVEYWFMLVLLEIFLIYLTINFFCKQLQLNEKCANIIFLLIILVGWYLYFNKFVYINTGLRRILSVGKLVTYFQYFILGVLTRKFWAQINSFLQQDWIKTLSICLFTVAMIIIWKIDWTQTNTLYYKIIHDVVVRYLGLVVFFMIFMNSSHYFDYGMTKNEKEQIFSKILKFIGERTMDIYLIHYFFLPRSGAYKEFSNMMFYFFECNNNIVLETLVVVVLSSLIIAITLGVSYMLRQSKFLAHYLFGAKTY